MSAPWPPTGFSTRWVRSGGAELWTVTGGSGPPAVLLHAGVADSRMWADLLPLTDTGHRVIAYDRRGFGRTRYEPEAYSDVDDLIAVLDGLEAHRPAVLVGCSQGGRVAIDATLQAPRRVGGLLLVAPAVRGAPEPDLDPATRTLSDRLDGAEADGDLDLVNRIEAHLWLDGPAEHEGRVGGVLRERFLEMNGRALTAADPGEPLPAPDAWPRLGEIGVPTSILVGTADLPMVRDRCRRLAAAIPGATLRELPDVAHLPSMEDPAGFATLLGEFLSRVGGP